jgi:hypothetical protein
MQTVYAQYVFPFISIHDKLPCITTIMHSNSGEFLPLQVHHESNATHSLPSLHPLHTISHMKINPNFRKNYRTLHQHP